MVLGLRFKDAINIATTYTMFKSSNQVMNIEWIQFWILVLDLFQILVIQKFHSAITIIIK
jgi:hypothetical protein